MLENICVYRELSTSQRGIWYAQLLKPQSPGFHVAECLEIHGKLDHIIFEAALRRVVSETEALHVRFSDTKDGPRQRIDFDREWSLRTIDLTDDANPWSSCLTLMRIDVMRRVDLITDPLFTFWLIKLKEDHFVWYQRYHHIVMDLYGCALVVQRVGEVYTALIQGTSVPISHFESVYSILNEDAKYRSSAQFVCDREFWSNYLTDFRKPLRPIGVSDPSSGVPISEVGFLDPSQMESVTRIARNVEVSVAHLLIAEIGAYFH